MPTPVLPKNRFQQDFSIPFAHAAGSDADVLTKLPPLRRDGVIERVVYLNLTGLAQHASNFASLLARYPLVVADDLFESVDTDADTVKLTKHGLETLDGPIRLTGSDLPDGLAAATDYYVIRVDDDNIAFATSPATAIAGTKIDLVDAGSGVQTLVDTASTRRVFAYYSTDSDLPGSDNGIPANAYMSLTLNRTRTLYVPKDTLIEFAGDEEGTTNIPAGSGLVEGHFVR